MKEPKAVAERFVLTYDDFKDPSQDQTKKVMGRLRSFQTEEVVPGTIRIKGPRQDVEQATHDIEDWRLSTEKTLSDTPPHKSQLR